MKSLSKWLTYIVVIAVACFYAGRVAGATYYPEDKWSGLDSLAAQVIGHPVDVRCSALGESNYFFGEDSGNWPQTTAYTVFWPDGRRGPVVLSSRICAGALLAVVDPTGAWCNSMMIGWCGLDSISIEGIGLYTLLHELGHVTLGLSEGQAECFALARVDQVAITLGTPPERAAQYLDLARIHHSHLPDTYREGCP